MNDPTLYEALQWAVCVAPVLAVVIRWLRPHPPTKRQQVLAWASVAAVVGAAQTPYSLPGEVPDVALEVVAAAAIVWGWPAPRGRRRVPVLGLSVLAGGAFLLAWTAATAFALPDDRPFQTLSAPCGVEVRVHDTSFLDIEARVKLYERVAFVLEREVASEHTHLDATDLALEVEDGCTFVVQSGMVSRRYPVDQR